MRASSRRTLCRSPFMSIGLFKRFLDGLFDIFVETQVNEVIGLKEGGSIGLKEGGGWTSSEALVEKMYWVDTCVDLF